MCSMVQNLEKRAHGIELAGFLVMVNAQETTGEPRPSDHSDGTNDMKDVEDSVVSTSEPVETREDKHEHEESSNDSCQVVPLTSASFGHGFGLCLPLPAV